MFSFLVFAAQFVGVLPRAQGLPRRVDVCVKVLLRRLACADAVARVVVGKDVAVDSGPEANVEAAHLAQIHCVPMREEHGEPAENTEDEISGAETENAPSAASVAPVF